MTSFANLQHFAEETGAIETPPRLTWHTGFHCFTSELPPVDCIIDGLFERGDKAFLFGGSKTRKTFFAIQAALSIAAGRSFLGLRVPEPRRVGFLNLEIKESHFNRRLRRVGEAIGIGPADIDDRLIVSHGRGKTFRFCDLPEVDLLFGDPLYKILAGYEAEENVASDVSAVLGEVDPYANRTGAAVRLIPHFAKGRAGDKPVIDRGSGSGVIARDFDASVTLTPHAEEHDAVVVDCLARNFPSPEPFVIRWGCNCFEVADDLLPVVETSRTAANRAQAGPDDDEVLTYAAGLVVHAPMGTTAMQGMLRKEHGIGQKRAAAIVTELSEQDGFARWRESGFSGKGFIGLEEHRPEEARDL